jgi:hypothetical protein
MFDEKTLFDFDLHRIKCRIILFLMLYESRLKSRWTKIMSISKNCYQNRKFVFWNRQKWNLFRSIFILMNVSMKKHKSLLIVCILNYWTLINSIHIMRMILSWWWMMTKSELELWIVNFSIRCKKSQSTSVINERCRSMRYFICVTVSTVDHWSKLVPKRVQCWDLLSQHATRLYKIHIFTSFTSDKIVIETSSSLLSSFSSHQFDEPRWERSAVR